ncbi:MAG: 5-methyltetrahydropteroyltriglutamate--homocysteine methyltransferase, partial [Hyphomicrobiaceae bacterium]
GHVQARSDHTAPVPRIVGKLSRPGPVEVRDLEFLKANTTRPAKITLPGPFTMGKQAVDEFYRDPEALAMELAGIVNEEAHDLERAGADFIQLDEPWVRHDPEGAGRYAVKAINRALDGLSVPTVVHLCFGYAAVVPGAMKPASYTFLAELADTVADTISIESAQPNIDLGVLNELAPKNIMLGVVDLSDPKIETSDVIADRIREGLKYLPPERLMPAPDCGMKYLPRDVAYGKLKSMAAAAAIVREELFEG